MPRHKKLFRYKVKKQTIYSLTSLLMIGFAVLITISFFQSGSGLDRIREILTNELGWGIMLLPPILVLLGLMIMRLKLSFTRPHVPMGLTLAGICAIAITQAGSVGVKIWENFAYFLSGIGALLVLLAMLGIGLLVLLNISIDEIVDSIRTTVEYISKMFTQVKTNHPKPVFVEKLPIRNPSTSRKEVSDNKPVHIVPQPTKQKPVEGATTQPVGLGTSVISNLPVTNAPWEYPPLSLLSTSPGQKADRGDMKQNAHTIEKTLESFGVAARVVEVNLGPAVTQYALEIALGTKLSKITSLSNDLALALAAPTGQIRIEAPIPGRSLVGIEIPNRSLEFVTLRTMLSHEVMKKSKDKLQVALGLDVSGTPVTANISKMPHVLIAGTTGSGKSVLINSWIASLLYRTNPSEVRLILVDPKRVELTLYNGIPHLLTPVIVEPDKIISALRWGIGEMERRYKLFAEVGVRNIDSYNELSGFQAIPYIVIFIDELADLMSYAPSEVEEAICRLAQMARATGIHLVVATQRPSVDVITGLIKANIPTRLAFNVSSMIDSRVIIDMPGSEKLLGRGDMLYIPPDQAKPTRIQGTYISEKEVQTLVQFLKNKNIPVEYTKEITSLPIHVKKSGGNGNTTPVEGSGDGMDPLFLEAVRVVCQYSRASASLLQRRLSIGYARAARVIDQLEEEGIIGSGDGAKPRDVLIKSAEEYLARKSGESSEPKEPSTN